MAATNTELAPNAAPVFGKIVDIPLGFLSDEPIDIAKMLTALLLVIITSGIAMMTICFFIFLIIILRILKYVRL